MIKTIRHGDILRCELARRLWGKDLYRTAVHYIDGLLIDTGCQHTAHELANKLSEMPLQRVVNTHSHEDHIGANHLLQTLRADLEIRAHPLALPVLEDPHRTQKLQPYRRIFFGRPKACVAGPVEDGEVIETERHTFQVIHTPGHSLDHICLYEPDRQWLFSGDLFIGGQDRGLRRSNKIWEIIASLNKIAELPIKTLFPSSAAVRPTPRDEIHRKRDYLEKTGQRVLDLHRQGYDEKAIARKVFGRFSTIEWITLGHFSRTNLVHSYLDQKVG